MSKLLDISVDKIKIRERAREDKQLDDEFAKSISEKGIIQPITVDQDYNLLAGERRLLMCKQLSIDTIPCLVRESTDELDAKEIELFENIHRKNMNWPEECKLVKDINDLYMTKHKGTAWPWSKQATADLVGKSRPLITRKLEMAKMLEILPDLKNCKTEDDAVKMIKKIKNDIIIEDLRKEQEIKIAKGDADRVKASEKHYNIGDAFEGLAELAEMYIGTQSVISLFEIDPPYAIDLSKTKKRDVGSPEDDLTRYTEISVENYPKFLKDLAILSYIVAAPDCWMIFWHGCTWKHEVEVALKQAGWAVDDIPAIWTKGSGQTNNPTIYLARCYEPFYIARKGNPSIKNRGHGNVFPFPPVPPQQKYHPTQRPLELMMDILDTFAYPGSTVCVPFLGSGVTLRACYKLHMNGFGWDLDQKNKDSWLLQIEKDFAEPEPELELNDESSQSK